MITRIGPYMTAEDYGSEYAIFDRHNQSLGSVSWYPKWRKHVFAPFERTVLSEDCLRALADWMRGLDTARSTKTPSSR